MFPMYSYQHSRAIRLRVTMTSVRRVLERADSRYRGAGRHMLELWRHWWN